MKVLKLVLFSAIFIVLFVFSGCEKKYPDDNRRYTKTPKERLTSHAWTFDNLKSLTSHQYILDFMIGNGHYPIRFSSDNKCTGSASPFNDPADNSYTFNFNGSWEFIENEDKLKVTHNSNHYYIWTINSLTKSELVISNDSIKYYFKK